MNDLLKMDRRRNPNYKQVTGHIPKDMYLTFKTACIQRETNQSEAIEEAVTLWLEQDKDKNKT